ncbi:hypothetical protein PRIPAC_76946 [Pristionchus pacificus]|uniref:G protein-coupled receptor n=1 Tax=Pristionchus pacificus TaxID=54126 RepID=A0A2A6CQB3_PRIPA|nr:hypothetical protein PRIPAC_76946 [Pristionchus pacificus]|eukprot:PDM80310.1 G protein-coupled receptor [Pristionchus pacificus]
MRAKNSTEFFAHEVIRNVRHVFTMTSAAFSVPAVVIVAMCMNRSSRSYSINIILIIIIGVLSDIIVQLIWDPLIFLPMPCLFRENPVIAFSGSALLYYEVWVGITSLHAPTYMACFIDRHQAVLPPGTKWALHENAQLAIEISLVGMAIGMAFLLKVAAASKEATDSYLVVCLIEPMFRSQHPSCFDPGNFAIFGVTSVVGLACGIVLACLISVHTFAQLKSSSSLSEKKRTFNTMMSRVLIVQSIVPLGFVLIPLITALSFLLRFARGPLPISICFLVISAHSTSHSIVLLTMTPIYRRKAVELLKKHEECDRLLRSRCYTEHSARVHGTFTAPFYTVHRNGSTVHESVVQKLLHQYYSDDSLMVGVLSNVDLQLIWDPVLPMPTPCVLRSESFSTIFRRTFSGKMLRFHWRDRQHCITYWHILPRYFDVKPFQGFWLSITSLNMPTFTACFIDRHQAVLLPGSKWLLSASTQLVIEIILVIIAVGVGFLLLGTIASPEDTARYLRFLEIDWPQIGNNSPSCFDITMFTVFGFLVVPALLIGIAVVIGITYHTFAQLRLSLTMSEKKRQFNAMMTKVLIIQSVVPVALVVIPLIGAVGVILPFAFHFALITGPLPLSICFLFVSAHSSVHSIILLTMTPIYRRKAAELLKRVIGIRFRSILRGKENIVSRTTDVR